MAPQKEILLKQKFEFVDSLEITVVNEDDTHFADIIVDNFDVAKQEINFYENAGKQIYF